MIKIYVARQSRYPADTKNLKTRVKKTLQENNVRDAQVNVILVGERKMRDLAKQYLKEDDRYPLHEVLSFPTSQTKGDFVQTGNILDLGDIFVCYPEARNIAMKRNRMVDDVLGELVEHSTLHLLGIHHD